MARPTPVANSIGTVFEIAQGTATITTMASFSGSGFLLLSPNPNSVTGVDPIYGTTLEGGADSDGSLFDVMPGSATINTMASFTAPAEELCHMAKLPASTGA